MSDEFERETIDRLARIETMLTQIATLESRVRVLEDADSRRRGQIALVGSAAAVAGSILSAVISWILGVFMH